MIIAAPAIVGEAEDLRVLLGDAFVRVAHQDDDVRALDAADRVQDAHRLDVVVLPW